MELQHEGAPRAHGSRRMGGQPEMEREREGREGIKDVIEMVLKEKFS